MRQRPQNPPKGQPQERDIVITWDNILEKIGRGDLTYVPSSGKTLLYCAVVLQHPIAVCQFTGSCKDPAALNARSKTEAGFSALHYAAIVAAREQTETAIAIFSVIANAEGIDSQLLSSPQDTPRPGATAKQLFARTYHLSPHTCHYVEADGVVKPIGKDTESASEFYDAIANNKPCTIRTSDGTDLQLPLKREQVLAAYSEETPASPAGVVSIGIRRRGGYQEVSSDATPQTQPVLQPRGGNLVVSTMQAVLKQLGMGRVAGTSSPTRVKAN